MLPLVGELPSLILGHQTGMYARYLGLGWSLGRACKEAIYSCGQFENVFRNNFGNRTR